MYASLDSQSPLSDPSLQSQQKYLSLLLEAITGENEDLRRVSHIPLGFFPSLTPLCSVLSQIALTDVQSNASIANILPDLVQYMMETVGESDVIT